MSGNESNRNNKMSNKREIAKSVLSSKIMISYFVFFGGFLILKQYFESLDSISFLSTVPNHYAKYVPEMTLAIQIMLGLIGVIFVFYLGKFTITGEI